MTKTGERETAGRFEQTKGTGTDRKHRYKYPGDNGEDGQHLEGVETSTRTGETDQGVTPLVGRERSDPTSVVRGFSPHPMDCVCRGTRVKLPQEAYVG